MPRGPRLVVSNSYYHIICRGNNRQALFVVSRDFRKYLQILKQTKQKHTFKLYAYALMPNHIHLLIRIEESNQLSKIMKTISQHYAQWFNAKYKRTGHLWENRFKNYLITSDVYLLECCRYIELNPVRAKLVNKPRDYLWSSFFERKKQGHLPNSFLDKLPALDLLGSSASQQDSYIAYVLKERTDPANLT